MFVRRYPEEAKTMCEAMKGELADWTEFRRAMALIEFTQLSDPEWTLSQEDGNLLATVIVRATRILGHTRDSSEVLLAAIRALQAESVEDRLQYLSTCGDLICRLERDLDRLVSEYDQ